MSQAKLESKRTERPPQQHRPDNDRCIRAAQQEAAQFSACFLRTAIQFPFRATVLVFVSLECRPVWMLAGAASLSAPIAPRAGTYTSLGGFNTFGRALGNSRLEKVGHGRSILTCTKPFPHGATLDSRDYYPVLPALVSTNHSSTFLSHLSLYSTLFRSVHNRLSKGPTHTAHYTYSESSDLSPIHNLLTDLSLFVLSIFQDSASSTSSLNCERNRRVQD
ncbi:hypothetical protein SODALDRAFT_356329 [Sodiomyces alkalinus F11]|uniref:Uncharacterized protein n=1 Tax=Sodiomyces alkalinus (strain CBS 110278 / VKM F-3762 / F11) TaxID=1314773 RepID=A0A3N2Q0R3_SODAK|nr:hypothetical protein SODALDRAFT_356329 [Sodiomyces alkalinus F11]ROT40353.1 hypothetical protein SODALDRAFT_356329 [Sodiomyces alkalinus F11]